MGTQIDVALGLFSIYLLLSVLCSAVTEAISGVTRLRARVLRSGIDRLLSDPAIDEMRGITVEEVVPGSLLDRLDARYFLKKNTKLTRAIYQHPLIGALKHSSVGPSYIASHTFVAALLDVLRKARPDVKDGKTPLESLRHLIRALPEESRLRRAWEALLDGTVKDLDEAHARLQRWFDESMDRASGRYKRLSHMGIGLTALVIAVGFNADSLQISNVLSHDEALRQSLVAVAQEIAKRPPPEAVRSAPAGEQDPAADGAPPRDVGDGLVRIAEIQHRIEGLGLPVKWGAVTAPPGLSAIEWIGWWFKRIFLTPGLLVTALATSLGAPFYFDLLNKLVNLRTAGGSPQIEAKEPRKDER